MEKKLLKRLRNYLISEYEQDGIVYVSVSTANGDWELSYRGDSSMYMSIRAILDDDAAVENLCTALFVSTYVVHGADFYLALFDAVRKEMESAGVPDVSDEDDGKMLSESIEIDELKEKVDGYGEDEV